MICHFFNINFVYFQSNKNEKHLLRKVEAQKRCNLILNEILKINKRTKIDDNEVSLKFFKCIKINHTRDKRQSS